MLRHTGVRRLFAPALLGALVAGLVLGSSASASPSGVPSLKGVTALPGGAIDSFTPVHAPLGLGTKPVDYIVELSGNPVTVADADNKESGGSGLSASQKQSLRQQLQSAQAPVAQQIQQLGGTILGQFQSAYNGISVRIAADKGSDLEQISGVAHVYRSATYTYVPTNVNSVPLVGGPDTWGGTPSYTGTGIKIADIDTGVDYTHADFGGSGNPADYQTALASDTLPANPAWFGPSAPKVKGGYDFVGDAYDASSTNPADTVPQPDPNPLDCNSHGTHTAGTAAGFGVLADGSTYSGPYDASTISGNSWNVGPGVAPQADLYALKVFGCNGSVDDSVLLQAMEWAVEHNMDVINMSLGAPFGSNDSPSSIAARNTARDGVIVVSASGNEGSAPYMTGSPGAAEGTLAVAANDSTQSFPGATLSLSTGTTLTAIDANGLKPLPTGPFPLAVIPATANDVSLGDSDSISFGCSVADDRAAGDVTGKVIVVERGTCARVAKAIFGQQAGAAGVIMINSSTDYPPYEGTITSNPDDGTPYDVTIPFLGVQGDTTPSASPAGQALLAANGGTIGLAETTLPNPNYLALADFSSFGPRSGDSGLKPDVTAPGVSVDSAGMGTGTGALIDSGTSMATPHVTGVAALAKQAHPDWRRVRYWNAAVANTADPGGVAGYSTLGAGSGLVSAYRATHTQVTALVGRDSTSLEFGLYQGDRDFKQTQQVTLRNFGTAPVTFDAADALDQGVPHTVSVEPSSVTVPPHGQASVRVELDVAIASTPDAYSFNSAAGLVTFTPTGGGNAGIALNVPYLLVPAASSDLSVSGVDDHRFDQSGSETVNLDNSHGAANGVADWFAWGLKDRHDRQLGSDDLLAAGVQSYPDQGYLLFGIQVARPWSNPAEDEFDVLVDVNNDGTPDYDVVAADYGALTTGEYNGEDVVAVIDLSTGTGSIDFLAGANFNGTTMELPVLFSQLGGITAGTPISYTVDSYGLTDGTQDSFDSSATYDLFHPVFTAASGGEDVVAPGSTGTDQITVDPAEWQTTPQLGLLVLSQNNVDSNHRGEAQTFRLDVKAPQPQPQPQPQPEDVTCTDAFSGSARSVEVPAGATCTLAAGTQVANDVTVDHGATLIDQGAAIGGDLKAEHPAGIVVQGGSVGHDLSVEGLSGSPGGDNAICGVTVGHDLTVVGADPAAAAIVVGGSADCTAGNQVGHDLTVQGNGPAVDVSNNGSATTPIGHDLTVERNRPGGANVAANVVAHDAECSRNATQTGGGNTAGGENDGCG